MIIVYYLPISTNIASFFIFYILYFLFFIFFSSLYMTLPVLTLPVLSLPILSLPVRTASDAQPMSHGEINVPVQALKMFANSVH